MKVELMVEAELKILSAICNIREAVKDTEMESIVEKQYIPMMREMAKDISELWE